MATGLASWSTTAANNANADSAVNFAEGQAPSSLNDSGRGLMSSAAKYRRDISGYLTTGGTSTAFTVSTQQNFASLAAMDTQVITIVPHTTCGAAPTLSVDGLTAKQIRTATGVSVASGVLVAGTPYALVYFASAGEFIMMNFVDNPYIIPVGGLLPYLGSTAPNSNFAMPYGQAISRVTYATLFNLPDVGTTHGVGNGVDTFNLPDLRGRGISFWDSMGGSSANRLTNQSGGLDGDSIGATGGEETHVLVTGELASHTHTGTTSSNGAHTHVYERPTGPGTADGSNPAPRYATDTGAVTSSNGDHTHTITTDATGSGTAHNNVQPTIILPCILRII